MAVLAWVAVPEVKLKRATAVGRVIGWVASAWLAWRSCSRSSSWSSRAWTSLASRFLQDGLEPGQVLLIGPAHRTGHDRTREFREAGGLAPVAEPHPGPAIRVVIPGVSRFHRKRPLGCRLNEPLVRNQFLHFVGVGQAPAEETGHE